MHRKCESPNCYTHTPASIGRVSPCKYPRMEEEILSKAVAWKPAAIENGSDAVAARERRDSSREREERNRGYEPGR